mmetsp:Transcript_11937/g.17895  ORF Transcript_11937/g.17895 Transcript_11937/m.17895 type:complete len:225 (+) Transcript_11937:678-1352(+)
MDPLNVNKYGLVLPTSLASRCKCPGTFHLAPMGTATSYPDRKPASEKVLLPNAAIACWVGPNGKSPTFSRMMKWFLPRFHWGDLVAVIASEELANRRQALLASFVISIRDAISEVLVLVLWFRFPMRMALSSIFLEFSPCAYIFIGNCICICICFDGCLVFVVLLVLVLMILMHLSRSKQREEDLVPPFMACSEQCANSYSSLLGFPTPYLVRIVVVPRVNLEL